MTYSLEEISNILAEWDETDGSLPWTKFAKRKRISRFALKSWLRGDVPTKKSRRISEPMDVDLEAELASWIQTEWENGNPVTRLDIQALASAVGQERGHHSFKASDGWTTNFLRRHDFTQRAGTKEGRKFIFTSADIVRCLSLQNRSVTTDALYFVARGKSIFATTHRIQGSNESSAETVHKYGPDERASSQCGKQNNREKR